MIGARRAGAVAAAGLAAALSVAAAPSAQAAARPGWRIVSIHRFGGSPPYSTLVAAGTVTTRTSIDGAIWGYGPVS
jgi:hypothetical protein